MSLTKKFNKAVIAGLVALTVLTACSPPHDVQTSELNQTSAELCLVLTAAQIRDKDANYIMTQYSTYDFTNGLFLLQNGARLSPVVVAFKDLAEGGQARTVEMFKQLGPNTTCPAPKFGP